ncbi:MAG: hypothetical protein QM767_15940 [Anaeromyxobacter sp.]
MTDPKSFVSSGRDLEDSFFLQEDRKLLEWQRKLRQQQESRQALAQASGIRDEKVLDRLVALGVRPESLAPLALFPIIEVAWADGKLDERERKAVLDAAEARGYKPGQLEYEMLQSWLQHRPSPSMFETWEHYVAGLLPQLGADERASLRGELLQRARKVAEAAGGFLGLGKISASEEAAIARLERALAG